MATAPTAPASSADALLERLNKEGTTIVMVTHSPAHADYAHRTVNLFDGHIITDNTRAA